VGDPGGVVEAGVEPWAACRREVAEELGLDLPLGGLLVVDWAPGDAVWSDSLNFVFDGGVLEPGALRDVRLPADELAGWRFEPPAVVASRVRPEMARRLAAAVAARGTTYAVNGRKL
jgi:8-oxo-dGTP pyrophosphatase MutT (NUDIX family)